MCGVVLCMFFQVSLFFGCMSNHGNSHGLKRIQPIARSTTPSSCGNSEKAWNEKRRPVYKTCQDCSSGPAQNPRRQHPQQSKEIFKLNVTKQKHDTKNAPKKHGIFPPPNLMANNQLTPLPMWKKNRRNCDDASHQGFLESQLIAGQLWILVCFPVNCLTISLVW